LAENAFLAGMPSMKSSPDIDDEKDFKLRSYREMLLRVI
jgi:hypothetical protein